jgi:hypothetical protein
VNEFLSSWTWQLGDRNIGGFRIYLCWFIALRLTVWAFWLWCRRTERREIAKDNKRDVSQNFIKLLRRKDNMASSNIAVKYSWMSRFRFSSRKPDILLLSVGFLVLFTQIMESNIKINHDRWLQCSFQSVICSLLTNWHRTSCAAENAVLNSQIYSQSMWTLDAYYRYMKVIS